MSLEQGEANEPGIPREGRIMGVERWCLWGGGVLWGVGGGGGGGCI